MSEKSAANRVNDHMVWSLPPSVLYSDKQVEGYIYFLTEKAGQTRELAEAVLRNPTPEALMAAFNTASLSHDQMQYLLHLQKGTRDRTMLDAHRKEPTYPELTQWASSVFSQKMPEAIEAENAEQAMRKLCQSIPAQYVSHLADALESLASMDAWAEWPQLKSDSKIIYLIEAINRGILKKYQIMYSWVKGFKHDEVMGETMLRTFGLFKIESSQEIILPDQSDESDTEEVSLYYLSALDPKYPSSTSPGGYWDPGLNRIVINADVIAMHAYQQTMPLLPIQQTTDPQASKYTRTLLQSEGYSEQAEKMAMFFTQSAVNEEISHCVNTLQRRVFVKSRGSSSHPSSLEQKEAFNTFRMREGTTLHSIHQHLRMKANDDLSFRLEICEAVEEAHAKTNTLMHSAFPQLEIASALDIAKLGTESKSQNLQTSGIHYLIFLTGLCQTISRHPIVNFAETINIAPHLITLDDATLRHIAAQTIMRDFKETPETLKRFPIPERPELLLERNT